MRKKIKKVLEEKWEVKYEGETSTSIWKYNSKISRTNPYEVIVEFKGEPKEKKPRTRKKKV